jgi:hypothetical protein
MIEDRNGRAPVAMPFSPAGHHGGGGPVQIGHAKALAFSCEDQSERCPSGRLAPESAIEVAQSRRTVLAHARGAVKLGILDAFRPGRNVVDHRRSVRRAEQDSRHDQEHDRGKLPVEPHPVLAVSGIGCGFCGSSRSRMAFKAWV